MAPGDICGCMTLAALSKRGPGWLGQGRDVASSAVQPVATGELCAFPEALLEWVLGMCSYSGGWAETYLGLRLVALELLAQAQGGALPALLHLQGLWNLVLRINFLPAFSPGHGHCDLPWLLKPTYHRRHPGLVL